MRVKQSNDFNYDQMGEVKASKDYYVGRAGTISKNPSTAAASYLHGGGGYGAPLTSGGGNG